MIVAIASDPASTGSAKLEGEHDGGESEEGRRGHVESPQGTVKGTVERKLTKPDASRGRIARQTGVSREERQDRRGGGPPNGLVEEDALNLSLARQ
jgi:hypothetical protein